MEKYTFIDDLTSDVMFEAYGASVEMLFAHAAEALFSVVCDIGQIQPVTALPVHAEAEDLPALLHQWLSTLLTLSDIHNLFLCCFRINRLEVSAAGCRLEAEVQGEPLSQAKGATVVKGITYYGFEFAKTAYGYRARIAVDI